MRIGRFAIVPALLFLLVAGSGCDALLGLLTPNRINVVLVNNGDLPVDVTLYFGDDQNVLEDALTEFGTERKYTIAAGSSQSFSESCDDLQAIIIDPAELRVVGQIGPEKTTDVFRDGSDFNCGDTLTFTFDHSALIIDFDIAFNAQ